MKIILLQDTRGVGKRHDVKEVTAGYARNFLFPNKLAEPATPTTLKKLAALKSHLDESGKELKKHLEALARKISETALEFTLKTDKKGSVFGSVTKEDILKGMRDSKLIIKERAEIKIDHPIKKFGEYKVNVRLPKGIEAELKILVRPEKS